MLRRPDQKKDGLLLSALTRSYQISLIIPEGSQMKSITFSQAIDGFLLAANARRLSSRTIADYTVTYRKFQSYLQVDPPMPAITPHQVEKFLSIQPVSKKTILNYHTGLSSLWTWATAEGIVPENILQKVRRARPEKRAIQPYSQTDIQAMLGALSHSKTNARLACAALR